VCRSGGKTAETAVAGHRLGEREDLASVLSSDDFGRNNGAGSFAMHAKDDHHTNSRGQKNPSRNTFCDVLIWSAALYRRFALPHTFPPEESGGKAPHSKLGHYQPFYPPCR